VLEGEEEEEEEEVLHDLMGLVLSHVLIELSEHHPAQEKATTDQL